MRSGLAGDVVHLTLEHLVLVVTAVTVAVAIGVPAGVLLVRRAKWRRWLLGFTNIVQTIPSLALFGFLIPIPAIGGIGRRTAIVALILYALLPVIRNTMVAFSALTLPSRSPPWRWE